MKLSAEAFAKIGSIVAERSGIVLDKGKLCFVEQRITPIAQEFGISDLDVFVEQFGQGSNPRLVSRAIDAIATYETSFFRDMPAFKALREVVLPKLLKARTKERALNIWSGSCSSGQEAYSVLLTIQERFPELRDWTVRFVATDMSVSILNRARDGKYSQLEINRGLPAPLLLKYFSKAGLEWQIKPELRSRIEFRELNLVRPWPPLPKMDIILLRNVLVYFETNTKKDILGKASDLLRPDGFMFLGSAEMPLMSGNTFKKVDMARSGCFERI